MTPPRIKHSHAICLAAVLLAGAPPVVSAQNTPEMREIISRLERLEQENQALVREVQALREEVAGLKAPSAGAQTAASPTSSSEPRPAAPEPEDTMENAAVNRARIDELAQTKVESSQKFPLRITGMVLFNAFVNGRNNGNLQNPLVAAPGTQVGGGSVAQTTLGLLYNGPQTFAGGKVTGSLYMDFFGGSESSYSLGDLFRIRTANIGLNWTNTSLSFGQDKPIISPRDPDSLAQVGYSPLTAAGNLWIWQPQIRLEQRVPLSNDDGLKIQAGVFQTSSPNLQPSNAHLYEPEQSRPGAEGRLEYWHRWSETGRFEIAGGIHYNRNHLAGSSLPSDVYSLDFLFRPFEKLEFTGMFFHGRNVQVLGALPGFYVLPNGPAFPVRSNGGWAQLKLPITSRLAFNIYGGEQGNRDSDLFHGNIATNAAYFSNFMYRIAPNVMVSLEGGQVRTAYYRSGNRINDHYDLAIGYLF